MSQIIADMHTMNTSQHDNNALIFGRYLCHDFTEGIANGAQALTGAYIVQQGNVGSEVASSRRRNDTVHISIPGQVMGYRLNLRLTVQHIKMLHHVDHTGGKAIHIVRVGVAATASFGIDRRGRHVPDSTHQLDCCGGRIHRRARYKLGPSVMHHVAHQVLSAGKLQSHARTSG